MHWLAGSIVCRFVGHKPTLWSRPNGPFIFCLRCGRTLDKFD